MLAATLAAALFASAPQAPAVEGPSIERLLAEARARAEKTRSTLGSRLGQILGELGQSFDRAPERLDALTVEMLGFKDASTRPLVEALKEPKESLRGQNCARILVKSAEPNVLPELEAALGASAPAEQRARIAWILGRREGERPGQMLRTMLSDTDSVVIGQAALALGHRKEKEAALAIAEKLVGASPPLARSLLYALADLEEPKSVPAIAAFFETPAAADCAGAAAEAVKKLRAKELLGPAARLLQRATSSSADEAELARAIEKSITSADRDAISILKKMLNEAGVAFEIKEECAYALHAAKEPVGKQWLLQPVNDAIRENPEGATLLRSRGRIFLRLKLYREAQRDYDEIRKLANTNKKVSIDADTWIEAARANAGAKSYQPAADALRNALGLGSRPKAFRDYAEFADMRKLTKHAPLFEGD